MHLYSACMLWPDYFSASILGKQMEFLPQWKMEKWNAKADLFETKGQLVWLVCLLPMRTQDWNLEVFDVHKWDVAAVSHKLGCTPSLNWMDRWMGRNEERCVLLLAVTFPCHGRHVLSFFKKGLYLVLKGLCFVSLCSFYNCKTLNLFI